MIKKEIKYNGILTYWSLTEGTNRESLRAGFEALNKSHLLPEVLEDSQALKRSMQKHFGGSNRVLIRPLDKLVGYEVVNEDASGETMEYETECRMGIIAGKIFSNPLDHRLVDSVNATYKFEKQLVSSAKLGGVLVRAVQELQGISLRPSGGFYWVPDSSREAWEDVSRVVSNAHDRNRVWSIKTSTDTNTVEAVCDSLVAQCEKKLEVLEGELVHGDLGKRALATRERNAQELDSLMKAYEGILGKTLTSLRERAADAESAAVAAILEAMTV